MLSNKQNKNLIFLSLGTKVFSNTHVLTDWLSHAAHNVIFAVTRPFPVRGVASVEKVPNSGAFSGAHYLQA